MGKYLICLKSRYSKVYLEKGAKSPGIDLAGFLGRIKFDELLQASHAHALVKASLEHWLSDPEIWILHLALGYSMAAFEISACGFLVEMVVIWDRYVMFLLSGRFGF